MFFFMAQYSYALSVDGLVGELKEYKLSESSSEDCPAPSLTFRGNGKSLILGGHIFIGELNQPPLNRGRMGLNCFLKNKTCYKKANPNFYTKVMSTLNIFKDRKGSDALRVDSKVENWYYLDKLRTLHTKEIVASNDSMRYTAKVFNVNRSKLKFAESDLVLEKKLVCDYVAN